MLGLGKGPASSIVVSPGFFIRSNLGRGAVAANDARRPRRKEVCGIVSVDKMGDAPGVEVGEVIGVVAGEEWEESVWFSEIIPNLEGRELNPLESELRSRCGAGGASRLAPNYD